MKKFNQIILMLITIAFLLCINYPCVMALTDEEIAKIEKETWAISINTDVNDLYPEGIQYAIISEDPMPLFKANFDILKSKETERAIVLIVSWNSIFKKVTGDNVALLPPKSENQFSMRSNEPEGKKWLITKVATKRNGTILCWCMPIQVKNGETYSITLDEKNYLNLNKLI